MECEPCFGALEGACPSTCGRSGLEPVGLIPQNRFASVKLRLTLEDVVRPADAPFDGETDYPPHLEDRCPTDAEATALALDSGAVIQAKMAAEAAAEEELPKRKPAEAAHGRAGRTACPRDADAMPELPFITMRNSSIPKS